VNMVPQVVPIDCITLAVILKENIAVIDYQKGFVSCRIGLFDGHKVREGVCKDLFLLETLLLHLIEFNR
jgi:hypothetical protein